MYRYKVSYAKHTEFPIYANVDFSKKQKHFVYLVIRTIVMICLNMKL